MKRGEENEQGAEKRIEELAKPLADFLNENCHPYVTLVITADRIKVEETQLGIPIQRKDS